MKLWLVVLVVVVVLLLVGLVTPGQLGDLVRDAAAWVVEIGRTLVEAVRDIIAG